MEITQGLTWGKVQKLAKDCQKWCLCVAALFPSWEGEDISKVYKYTVYHILTLCIKL